MLNLLLIVTAISVAAQSSRSKITTIPFSFTVGEKTLPAGEYTVEPYTTQKVWLVRSRDGLSSVLFNTNGIRAFETQDNGKLVFRQYGGQHFLSQIWTAGENAGRELVVRRPKGELSKNGVERDTVVVPIGSGGQR